MPKSKPARAALIAMWTLVIVVFLRLYVFRRPPDSPHNYADMQRIQSQTARRMYYNNYVHSLIGPDVDSLGHEIYFLMRQPTQSQMQSAIGVANAGDKKNHLAWRSETGQDYLAADFKEGRLTSIRVQMGEDNIVTIGLRSKSKDSGSPGLR